MLNRILSFGVAAGLVVGILLVGIVVSNPDQPPSTLGMVLGYLIMLVALSLVFVAIKRHRDIDLGGVIRFWRAFGLGLGVSFVASLVYVLAWEVALAWTGVDFAASWTTMLIEQEKAKGVTGPALEQFIAGMEQFKRDYANPMYRLPMTFTEIFPLGAIVSLISAAILRNSRVLALRRA